MSITAVRTSIGASSLPSAPASTSPSGLGVSGDSPNSNMLFACHACTKRKVKCDKATPVCSSCSKGKFECSYRAPVRQRKRKLSENVNDRLALYERILQQHGLLPPAADGSTSVEKKSHESVSLRFNGPETSATGKLLASKGKSRYVDNSLWRTIGEYDIQSISSDEEEEEEEARVSTGVLESHPSDPLTGAFTGSQQNLHRYHPSETNALLLWQTHVENVEPLCKVLHIPSTFKIVDAASRQPDMASKSDDCLLFAIYHFAVFSMTDYECTEKLGQPRTTLMQKFHFATRQAFVNVSFLKTTEISVLQALVLFLLPCRYIYDPHTYWILTGVAVRTAQRMGLHRDGEKLGLPPFDVQMRRRVFYQVVALDKIASNLSGTGIAIMPDTWDTQQPSNIDDDHIWPGMTDTPEEQTGATDMIFCAARSCVGRYIAKAGRATHGIGSPSFKEVELAIGQAENELEEKYIRYCNVVNPLHFLTISFARAAITALRLRIRLPKARNQSVTDVERRELFRLSQQIIDTDLAAHDHSSLVKYGWYVRPFFAWGSWDSLIFILTSLWRPDQLSPGELDTAWTKIKKVYDNHGELLEPKQALQVAVGRLTLKAWDANKFNAGVPEPVFITNLRSQRKVNPASRSKSETADTTSSTDPCKMPDASTLLDFSSGFSPDIANGFNLDNTEWMFWDQLIQDYQCGQQ